LPPTLTAPVPYRCSGVVVPWFLDKSSGWLEPASHVKLRYAFTWFSRKVQGCTGFRSSHISFKSRLAILDFSSCSYCRRKII